MKIKRKVVPNKSAKDIPIEVSHSLRFGGLHINKVSASTSDDHLGMSHVVDHDTIPVSCPIISTSVECNLASFPGFCDIAEPSSSRDKSGMETGQISDGYGVINGAQNVHLNKEHLLVTAVPHRMELLDVIHAQVPMVDGLVSTFQVTNMVRPFSVAARQPTMNRGLFIIETAISWIILFVLFMFCITVLFLYMCRCWRCGKCSSCSYGS